MTTETTISNGNSELLGRLDYQSVRVEYPSSTINPHEYPGDMSEAYRPTMDDIPLMPGFEDDFAIANLLLLDTTGLALMEEWNEFDGTACL
jgi:hypothetical protein